VRADNGPVELAGDGALIDACAVFAEREDVGGPEENIERVGVVKSDVGCPEGAWALASNSDVEGRG
jgi:hypothetical protein